MKTPVLVLFLLLLPFFAGAHPSWGLAITPSGDLYFVDVLHHGDGTLWKLDRHGKVTPVLRQFHSHDLFLAADGRLWLAQAIWRTGEIEGEGHNYLLRYDPNTEALDTLVFTDDWDEFYGSSIAADGSQSVLFTIGNQVFRKQFDGPTELLFEHRFERINTLCSDPDGGLWITDKDLQQGSLLRWTPADGLDTIATKLIPTAPSNPPFPETRFHLFYGINCQETGKIYVAESAGRQILEVDEMGRTTTFYQSESPWYPVNLVFQEGVTFVMEVGYEKEHLGPRILRLGLDGRREVLADLTVPPPARSATPGTNPQDGKMPFRWWWLGVIAVALLPLAGLKRRER